MRLILTLILSVVATVAHAATVTGTIQDANGDATTVRVEFWPLTTPLQTGDALITTGRPVRTTATDGVLSVSLVEGLYQVRIGGYDKIKISVPSGSASYEIGTLTSDGITYIPPTLADSVGVSLSPTNYTALDTNILQHLEGIDVALASSGGGSVDLTGTNDLAGTGQLLNADYISSSYMAISTNITDHNSAQYAGVLITTTNLALDTDWMANTPYGLTVAGTDGMIAAVGTSEGGHTAAYELVQVSDDGGTFVDKFGIIRTGVEDGSVLEVTYSNDDPDAIFTVTTNIVFRLYPSGYAQVRGDAAVMSLYDDTYATADQRHYGLRSDDGTLYLQSYDNFYYGGIDNLSTWDNGGNMWVKGELQADTLSVSNSISSGYLTISTNITDHDSPQYAGVLITTTNLALNTNWMANTPYGLTVAGTDGFIAVVGTSEGGHTAAYELVQVSDDGGTFLDKFSISRSGEEDGATLDIGYSTDGPDDPYTKSTNIMFRWYPSGYAQVRGENAVISLYDDTYASTEQRHYGLRSDDGTLYLQSYDNFYYGGTDNLSTWNQGGDLWVKGGVQADTLSASNNISSGGQILAAAGSAGSPSIGFSDSNDGTGTGIYSSGDTLYTSINGEPATMLNSAGLGLQKDDYIGWSINSTSAAYASQVRLYGANNTLEQRYGTSPQTSRVYGSYTDASNYERLSLSHDGSGAGTIAVETAGTGADDQDLVLKPAGAGQVYIGDSGTGSLSVSNITATGSMTIDTLNIGRVLTPFNNLTLDSTNLVVDCASTNTFGIIELTGDCYIIASNLTAGARAQIEVRADGTARTITAVPDYKASGAESFSLTVTNHAVISLFNTGTATTNVFIGGAWFE